jgi:spore coat polysaccharide biosynthesis predicted glycosyltransferase SpsG
MKIAKFLRKSKRQYFEKACILCEGPTDVKKLVCKIANSIRQVDINFDEGGIEDDAHVTVLYGVDDNVNLQEYFKKPIQMKLDNKVSYFDNDNFSVAKIDVLSDELKTLHNVIRIKEPNEHTYSDGNFHAHVTISYLKKGKRLEKTKIPQIEWAQKDISLQKNGLMDKYVLPSD